jgi:hypothetical protein
VADNDVNETVLNGRLAHPLVRLAATALAAGLLLSTAGAFDTEAAAFGPRLLYWLAIAAIGIVALEVLHRLLARQVPAGPELLLRLVGWAVLALPLNMVAVLSCKLLFGGWPSMGGFLLLLPGMAAILAALQFVLASFRPPAAAARAAAPDPAAGLAEFLPLPLRHAPILALEAQDHYVRVHTVAGHALIRLRLRDAVALVGADGVQPHRSWWVARSAISSLRREHDRIVILLSTGQQVPVSRSARPLLGPLFDGAQ